MKTDVNIYNNNAYQQSMYRKSGEIQLKRLKYQSKPSQISNHFKVNQTKNSNKKL